MRGEFSLTNVRSFRGRHTAPISRITLIYGPNSHGKSTLLRNFVRHCWGTVYEEYQNTFHRMDPLRIDGFLSSLSDRDATLELATAFRPGESIGDSILIGHERRYARPHNASEYACGVLVGGAILGRGADIPFAVEVPECSTQKSAFTKLVEHYGDDFKNICVDDIGRLVSPFSSTYSLSSGARDAIIKNLQVFEEENELFGMLRSKLRSSIVNLSAAVTVGENDFQQIRLVPSATEDKTLYQLASYVSNFIQGNNFDHFVAYIGPSRRTPESLYEYRYDEELDDDGTTDTGLNFEGLLARAHHLNILPQLNEQLRLVGMPYRLVLEILDLGVLGPRLKATVLDVEHDLEMPLSSVGFGVSQILPIILASTTLGSRICVEQPELHLHPLMQANVADYIIHTAQREHNPASWLIETHSEAMMLRIQRRIRENKLDPKDVTVLYVGQIGDRGSVIEELRLNELGEFIDEWPGGFFEMDFDDIF